MAASPLMRLACKLLCLTTLLLVVCKLCELPGDFPSTTRFVKPQSELQQKQTTRNLSMKIRVNDGEDEQFMLEVGEIMRKRRERLNVTCSRLGKFVCSQSSCWAKVTLKLTLLKQKWFDALILSTGFYCRTFFKQKWFAVDCERSWTSFPIAPSVGFLICFIITCSELETPDSFLQLRFDEKRKQGSFYTQHGAVTRIHMVLKRLYSM